MIIFVGDVSACDCILPCNSLMLSLFRTSAYTILGKQTVVLFETLSQQFPLQFFLFISERDIGCSFTGDIIWATDASWCLKSSLPSTIGSLSQLDIELEEAPLMALGWMLVPNSLSCTWSTEPLATFPTVVSISTISFTSGIIFENGTDGFTFCKFCFNIPTDSASNLRNFDGLGSKSVGYTPLRFLPEVSDACRGLNSFCDITGLCCTVLFPGIPHFLGLEVQLRLSACSTVFFLDISSSFQITAITWQQQPLFPAGHILSHSAARILELPLFWTTIFTLYLTVFL